jgi:hypothetical protein
MKIVEFIAEVNKKEPIKPRDPNWRDMEALRKSGAAGSHGDKTKTIPRKEKHKKISSNVDENATAGSTSSGNIATVVSPHIAIGDKKARDAYGKKGMPANPPKAKMQKPTDNALDMKGVSLFGGTLKR